MKSSVWLLSLAALVLQPACGSDGDEIPSRFRDLATRVDEERVRLGVPGVAVAVVEHGVVTFSHGFGVKGPGSSEEVTASTLFRIGSTTKPLTAIAVLSLVDQGLVGLDDTVVSHVPAFSLAKTPERSAQVTVRELLAHSSGIVDYDELVPPAEENDDSGLATFLTGRFGDIDYVASPPGKVWAYANPNFMLAGLVAELAAGLPYRMVMRERVLDPLGMTRSTFLPSEVEADGDYAVGENCTANDPGCPYVGLPSVIGVADDYNAWSNPAGGLWSSVEEVARLAAFLTDGKADVLSETLRAEMETAQISTHDAGPLESYGLGLFLQEGFGAQNSEDSIAYYPTPIVTHGGDVPGYASTLLCFQSLDICFVALANKSIVHFDNLFADLLSSLVTMPPAGTMPDLAPDPSRYELYAGDYDDPFGIGLVHVTTSDGKLYLSLPALDAEGTPYEPELEPYLIDSFLVTVDGAQQAVIFIADETGTYTYVRARPYVAVRVPPSP